MLVALLAAIGAKTAFVPVPPPRRIPTMAIPVLALSTEGALAVETAKESSPPVLDTGRLSAIDVPILTVFLNLLGFSLAALYFGLKDDLKEVKDMSRDLTTKVNQLILLAALYIGVSGYAALKP